MKKKIIIILVIVLAFILGVIGSVIFFKFFPIETSIIKKDVTIKEQNSLKESIDKVYDSVVYIETSGNNYLNSSSSGTGFFYKVDKNKGYIITNHHVIEGSSTIKITNTAGNTVDAKLLGSDEFADIAVLSVDKEAALKVAEFGSNDNVSIGDTVFTVGSPMGSEYMGTVTKGILSGKNRTVDVNLSSGKYVMEVLQTDAAINPGNSGGPLFNINGEVIGVISMKLVQNEIEGMGFALPIEMVSSSIEKLEKGEAIDRPIIGIEMLDINNPYALFYNGIKLDENIESGVVVVNVSKNSPASKAGLKKGDVIVAIDDHEIKNSAYLRFTLYKYNVGDTVKIKYIRNGKLKDTKATLVKNSN